METSYEEGAAGPRAPQLSAGVSRIRHVFVGDHGIRVGWSVLLFAAIFGVRQAVVTAVLGRFVSLDISGPAPLGLGLLTESCALLPVAAATWVMARLENRPFLSYGYTDDHKLMRLATGGASIKRKEYRAI